MSVMGEPMYTLHTGRGGHHAQDLTPYSAVSSFNLPAHYDSSLITPVSMTSSPSVPTKPAPTMRKEKDIKLSPSSYSPSYQLFCADDDYNPRYNPPMKLKDPNGTLQMSSGDSSFPPSPFLCTSPYYGSFGVSATPQSARTSASSPSVHPSPHLPSAGGMSNDSHHSHHEIPQSATSYRANNQAPILIAPNPLSFRPATKESGPYRQNSNQSSQSTSQTSGPTMAYPEPLRSVAPGRGRRNQKRKSPSRTLHEDIIQSGELSAEEQLLIQLAERDNLPWKEVAAKFNKATGKDMKIAALQMRKKRLIERLRVWTDEEEKALALSYQDFENQKWSNIAKGMSNHGSKEKFSKEAVQKKWQEMHPDGPPYLPDYPPMSSDLGGDQGSWSEGRDSSTRSLHDDETEALMSALSTATMDETNSRALGDASEQMRYQQQQIMLERQHQQHEEGNWGSGA